MEEKTTDGVNAPAVMTARAGSYDGARVGVLGLGREGRAVARVLSSEGARVTVSDRRDRAALDDEIRGLDGLPKRIRFALGDPDPAALLGDCDLLVLSPGVDKRLPLVQEAVRRGIPLSSETALFTARCRAPIVGVTGSAGKTTTTTLTGRMLAQGPRAVFVGGNIGTPLLERLGEIEPDAVVVLELSSFQLEGLAWSPHVAVVTNITPNHLDRHGTMEEYAGAKRNIVAHQRPGDYAVLNKDDARTPWLAEATPGRVLYFSLTGPVDDGAYLSTAAADAAGERWLVLARGGVSTPLCRASTLRVPGLHNIANVLAAATVAAAEAIPLHAVNESIAAFDGVAHRLEKVGTFAGTTYYDDSIATAPERTLAALAALSGRPTVLILGGRDKHLPWRDLARAAVRQCRGVILIGEAAGLIRGHLESALREDGGGVPLLTTSTVVDETTMASAVARAATMVQPGDAVLLAPGCTSYDMYRDFAARGDDFALAVGGLAKNG